MTNEAEKDGLFGFIYSYWKGVKVQVYMYVPCVNSKGTNINAFTFLFWTDSAAKGPWYHIWHMQLIRCSFCDPSELKTHVCFQSKQDYIQGQAQEVYVWTSAELKSFSWCFPDSVLIVSTAQAQQGPLVVSLCVLLRKLNAHIKSIHM